MPAGQRAIHRYTREEDGLQLRALLEQRVSTMPDQGINARPATTAASRRWEHEAVIEADAAPS